MKLSPYIICVSASVLIVLYILIANTVPFSVNARQSFGDGTISKIAPSSRVEYLQPAGSAKITDSPVYFDVFTPLKYDNAIVEFKLFDLKSNQNISVGYQDSVGYHYNVRKIDTSSLNDGTLSVKESYVLTRPEKVNRQLKWIIQFDNIDDDSSIVVKDISVSYFKKGWIK